MRRIAGRDKFSLNEVVAGTWDPYIDKWADAARDFGHPLIVVFGVEMNGTWFPWSGAYYGGAEWDKERNNWKGPEIISHSLSLTWWITFARAARQISSGCFTRIIIPIPMKPGTARLLIIPVPITSIGLASAFTDSNTRTNQIQTFLRWYWPYEEICRLDPEKAGHDCGMGDG
jgi:hypothetical protein